MTEQTPHEKARLCALADVTFDTTTSSFLRDYLRTLLDDPRTVRTLADDFYEERLKPTSGDNLSLAQAAISTLKRLAGIQ